MRFSRILPIILAVICSSSWINGAEPTNPNDQLKLDIRLFELEGPNQETVGFDWYLGSVSTNLGSGEIGGTWPQAGETQTAHQGRKNAKVGTLSGILNDPQFRTVIRALEQREGVVSVIDTKAPATSGAPVKLQRPDGWQIQVLPRLNGKEVELEFELAQTKGEYAGFLFSSRVKVRSGETVIFSDLLGEAKAGKKLNSVKRKRLMFFIEPTVGSKAAD